MELIPIAIDFTYLNTLTEGDKVFEQILLKCTIDDIDTRIEGLKNSWKLRNVADIRENAHSLVSLSAIAGLPQVEEWSRMIDQKFADGVFHSEMEIHVINSIETWAQARVELKKITSKNLALQL